MGIFCLGRQMHVRRNKLNKKYRFPGKDIVLHSIMFKY